MSNEIILRGNDLIFYSTPDGSVRVEVIFQDETFWMTQKQIAELFGVEISTISEHLQGIFANGELQQDSVIRKFRITAADGKNYLTGFYHLDAIIAVSYRVNSRQATQFRIWATNTLREFIVKGFVLDDGAGGVDYRPQAEMPEPADFRVDGCDDFVKRSRIFAGGNRQTFPFQTLPDYTDQAVVGVFFPQVLNSLFGEESVYARQAAKFVS